MRAPKGISAAVLLAAATLGCPAAGGPAAGGPGGAMPMPSPEVGRPTYLNPGTLNGIPGFTNAVRLGNTVQIAGQVALDDQGRIVGPGDLAAQARQAFANLSHVLTIAGSQPDEILRMNVYVVNLKPGDWDVIKREGAAFFPARNPPAGTVLGVQALPRDSLLLAIDATAVIRAMFRPRQR
jgi:enamine deaminase RidA (YjgF/YER057c/UK114 family)